MTTVKSHKRCVLVLGSHRSGTSVLTKSLHVAGVFLGDTLYKSRFDNPKGFFEDTITHQLNESLLKRMGKQWNSLLLPNAVDLEVITEYQNGLKKNVFRRFEGVALWGLKDPRISRLWPHWLPVFLETETEPLFVLANRHPYSVAKSLLNRDQMPEAQALALWAVHQLEALDALLQQGGLVVDYDLMMDRPRQQLQRIAGFLGLEAELETSAVENFASAFLAENLRHSRVSDHTKQSEVSPLQALCLRIYGELLNLAQLPRGLTPEAVKHMRVMAAGFRSDLASSMDWMRAIDALQDALGNVSLSVMGEGVSMVRDARLNPSSADAFVASSRNVASDLESIVGLLEGSLARRNQTISKQALKLEKMREELLRAEAQLDLLKELMLGGDGDVKL